VTRLIDIGVENFLISSALRGVLAQRLVRRICSHCRAVQGRIAEHLGSMPEIGDFEMYTGSGCVNCSGSGYSGRIGIYELLTMTDAMCRAVAK
jgi:type II secretory ATPase GspE/PulE/Tfp pilus assembly ATPase PilB-like protein